jgi:hypothetical protein
MTGMNPTLLASWSAVVTVLHSTGTLRVEPLDAVPFALAVGIGSAGWFALLVAFLNRHHRKLGPTTVGRVVKGVGWIMVAAGLYLGALLVRDWGGG